MNCQAMLDKYSLELTHRGSRQVVAETNGG